MAKKVLKENIRVEINLARSYLLEAGEEEIQICDNIISQIKKHVDDVGQCGVIWDESIVCEHCEYEWEVNEDPDDPDFGLGEPFCCIKAQKEWKEEENEKY